MLHIVTALYRPKLLKDIHKSLPDASDITWHIGVSLDKELDYIPDDVRVKIYKIDCPDVESWTKRQVCLDSIKEGYYCFLDDDTVFHNNLYKEYKKLKQEGFVGMFIGKQENKNGKIRLAATYPKFCQIDIGNVISHSECIEHIKFPVKLEGRVSARDYQYWRDVFNYYTIKNTKIIKRVISTYNGLR